MTSINPYQIYKDAFTKPTLVDEICDSIDYLIENRMCGIFHIAGDEMIDRVSLLKRFYQPKYSQFTINYMINPVETPSNSDIQKFIDIETSIDLKRFLKTDLKTGLELQMRRTYK